MVVEMRISGHERYPMTNPSIVIPHNLNTRQHLFFPPRSLLLRRVQITLHSRLDPIPRFDPLLRTLVFCLQTQPLEQRTINNLQVQIVRRPQKVQQPQPIKMRLIRRRRHHAMHARLQVPVRPELQHVRDVHRDAPRVRLHPLPTAVRRQDLQRRDRLPEQQRQRPEVRVTLRVHVLEFGVFLRRARVVDHVAEMAVRDVVVFVSVGERVFRQFQHERDEGEQFPHGVLRDVALEGLDFGAVVLDDGRVGAGELRREFEDVVHFDVVAEAREDFDGAQGPVAGVVAVFEVGAVLQLLFGGEVEEVLADGELAVDLVLGEAEVGDVAGRAGQW